jgi:hypothetical protein
MLTAPLTAQPAPVPGNPFEPGERLVDLAVLLAG